MGEWVIGQSSAKYIFSTLPYVLFITFWRAIFFSPFVSILHQVFDMFFYSYPYLSPSHQFKLVGP